jgi:hypothetical protein
MCATGGRTTRRCVARASPESLAGRPSLRALHSLRSPRASDSRSPWRAVRPSGPFTRYARRERAIPARSLTRVSPFCGRSAPSITDRKRLLPRQRPSAVGPRPRSPTANAPCRGNGFLFVARHRRFDRYLAERATCPTADAGSLEAARRERRNPSLTRRARTGPANAGRSSERPPRNAVTGAPPDRAWPGHVPFRGDRHTTELALARC